ncbi:hypothetical protein ACTXT7_012628 [Hymenolepis weldensis]
MAKNFKLPGLRKLCPLKSKIGNTNEKKAVEYFAEWSLMPDNTVYQRVDSEDLRPSEFGDRDKWFSDTLAIVPFQLWTERFDRGLLRPVVELLLSSTFFQHLNNCNHDFSPEWTSGKQLTFKASPSATQSSTSGACEIGTSSESDTPTGFLHAIDNRARRRESTKLQLDAKLSNIPNYEGA